MKFAANLGVAAVALACVVALILDVYPGVLNDLLFVGMLLAFVVVPVAAIAGVVIVIVLVWNDKLLKFIRTTWRRAALSVLLLVLTYGVLKFYVTRRLAFVASKSAFEALVQRAPSSDYRGLPLNQRLGAYYVDEYAADPRGGVYFRVHSGADGIGPDVMSYGFAYHPNLKGTPFGASGYRVFTLGRGWFWFRASDDWY